MQIHKAIHKSNRYILKPRKCGIQPVLIDQGTQWEEMAPCGATIEQPAFNLSCEYSQLVFPNPKAGLFTFDNISEEIYQPSTVYYSTSRVPSALKIDTPPYDDTMLENLPPAVARGSGSRMICLPPCFSERASPMHQLIHSRQLTPLASMGNLFWNPEESCCESGLDVYIGTPTGETPPLLRPIPRRLPAVQTVAALVSSSSGLSTPYLSARTFDPSESNTTDPSPILHVPSPDFMSTPSSARSVAPSPTKRADAAFVNAFESSPQSTAATELSPKILTCWPTSLLGPVVGAMPFQKVQGVLARPRLLPVSARALKADQMWMERQAKARKIKIENSVGFLMTNKPKVPNRLAKTSRITMNAAISWQRAKNAFEIMT